MKIYLFIFVLFLSSEMSVFSQLNEIPLPDDSGFFFFDTSKLDSSDFLLIQDIHFQLGRKDLLDSNDAHILALADFLIRHPNYIIEIGHHTDCRGSKASCYSLSQGRAEAICERLIVLGVNPDQLIAKGFGETVPIEIDGILYSCNYILQFDFREREELHALNRRIEIRILSRELKF